MSIFYEPGTGIIPEGFFDDGDMVEIPHSVLWSSLDAETIADTYGVAVEDVLMARQELFAQQPDYYPQASGTVTPRPQPRPRRPPTRRPPTRRPGKIIIRPRRRTGGTRGRVIVRDYRTSRTGTSRRSSSPRPRGPFNRIPSRR